LTQPVTFRTTLELHGKTATGIEVPEGAVAALAAGKKPAVHVRIGEHRYRSTVAAYGGRYLLPVSAEHRNAAGVAAGDELDVELILDTEPREVEVPADLAAALAVDPEAERHFASRSYTVRKELARLVEQAKRPETRQRRVEVTVEKMRAGATQR